jgi:hypothetical protein
MRIKSGSANVNEIVRHLNKRIDELEEELEECQAMDYEYSGADVLRARLDEIFAILREI